MQIPSTAVSGPNNAPNVSSPLPSQRAERNENDGDGDDAKGRAASVQGTSVNLQGQRTGQVVNAQA